MTAPASGAERARPPAGRRCPGCGAEAAAGRGGEPAARPRPVRCVACGLVFIDPIPPGALSAEAYGHDYYEPWQGREEKARIALWRRRLALLAGRAPGRALLDVGCGDGLFLKLARDAGWTAEGIEFSPEGARRAALRIGGPVAVGNLAREGMLRGPFDVATLWHVLEHLPDPAEMLDAVRSRLRAEGLLVVAVPNLDNVPMRTAYRLARLRALPLYEPGAREPHVIHFTPGTLRGLLARHGFQGIEIRADHCALTLAKRAIDAFAGLLSRLAGRLLTDAMVAFARAPR